MQPRRRQPVGEDGRVRELRKSSKQTWSSRDLSLGLETSRNPFLQVLVSVLVLDKQVLNPSLVQHLHKTGNFVRRFSSLDRLLFVW